MGLLFFVLADVTFASQANVFVYHRFGEKRAPSTNISLADFRAHLDVFRQDEYTVLTLGDVVARLKKGEALPDRTAVITVDDGYKSFLTGAMPLLEEYGYPATLFVSTAFVGGGRNYLTWDELRRIQQAGIEIGNHSHTHNHLVPKDGTEEREAWLARVRQDLKRSQSLFKKHLGIEPELLAYPYGEQTPEVQAIAQGLGFIGAAGQQSGVISGESNIFYLPRFPMGGPYTTLKSFESKLGMAPMSVEVVGPLNPVIGAGPAPELKLKIDRSKLAGAFNCFVQGGNTCRISKVKGEAGVYRVVAENPLAGRRNKYTITARGKDKRWYWFSYQWIQPHIPE